MVVIGMEEPHQLGIPDKYTPTPTLIYWYIYYTTQHTFAQPGTTVGALNSSRLVCSQDALATFEAVRSKQGLFAYCVGRARNRRRV